MVFSSAWLLTRAASSSLVAAPRVAPNSRYNSFMIPKSRKFPLRSEFIAFRKTAKKTLTLHTIVYHLKTTGPVRLSVIVPKKTGKLATTRTWLKRLTYDTLYPLIQDPKLDIVVVYKPLSLKKSPIIQKELIHELTQTISNL